VRAQHGPEALGNLFAAVEHLLTPTDWPSSRSLSHRWKDPEHVLRKDETFKLTGVPTLMKWGIGKPTARLDSELETCKTAGDVEKFVGAFLASA